MPKARWLAPWKDSLKKPARYHLVNRVVDRSFVLGDAEKEHFCSLMRKYESFSGCRVLSFCIMSNHFHILLEVPPMPEGGLSDAEFFRRLRVFYSAAFVKEIKQRLKEAREPENLEEERLIIEPFTKRMHDLSEFMRGLQQRFTRWFNRTHDRSGTLWESRFRSVIVESGTASRTMAAYIDLNPVRAGMVGDPAEYRWSSYGEAVAGVKRSQTGLVRALNVDRGKAGTAGGWSAGGMSKEYRRVLLGAGVARSGENEEVTRKGMGEKYVKKELEELAGRDCDLAISRVVRYRVRYFVDGAVIGSRGFVDGVFRESRERFGPRRTSGARKPRGSLSALAGELWSMRDLKEVKD